MNSRHELHNKLLEIMDGHKVYYQPPESIKLTYPCIIYKMLAIDKLNASNKAYLKRYSYNVTLIDSDPESKYADKLIALEYCDFDRTYQSGNMYHTVFTIHTNLGGINNA